MYNTFRVAFTAAIVAVCGALFADKYELKLELSGSDSIDWSDAASYAGSHSSGPSSIDTVYIPDGMTVKVTAGTDSWTSLNELNRLVPGDKAVLEVNVPASFEGIAELKTPVSDYDISKATHTGKLIKTGEGTLELMCYRKIVKASNGYVYDYYVNIDVAEGCLKLCTKGTEHEERLNYGNLYVEKDARLELCKVGYTQTPGLSGEGFVHLDNTEEQHLYIDGAGTTCYSGWMTGPVRIDIVDGRHDITCPTNTINTICLNSDAVCGYTKMGMSGQISSLGTGNFNIGASSGILYLGKENETSNKPLWLGQNAFVDGGEHGGLTLSGKLAYSGVSTMRIVTLCGSNSENPCIITGTFPVETTKEDKTVIYIKKKGSGIWQFAGGGTVNRSSLGVIDVMEGTLQFDSIAEKGKLCSLGYATNLFEATTTLTYETAKPVDYAFVLGGENTEGTMQYMGDKIAKCTTRPIAIRSKGGFVSDSACYWLDNVYALGNGEKTLALSGTSDHGNMATRLSNGKDGGVLNVEKRGSGAWTLWGTNTFTGSVVSKGGRMSILNPEKRYTWFRFTVKENGYGCPNDIYDTTYSVVDKNGNPSVSDSEKGYLQICELSVYDADGNNLVKGLKMNDDNFKLTPKNGYAGLNPGYVAYGRTSGCGLQGSRAGGNFRGFDNLFDGTADVLSGNFACAKNTGMLLNDEDTWVPIVFRLPEGETRIAVAMDVLSGRNKTGAGSYNGRNLISFRFEGSTDGLNWDILFDDKDRLEVAEEYPRWYSDLTSKSFGVRKGAGFAFNEISPSEVFHSHAFTCVGASNGGVIDIVGNPYTVSGLVVDASASAGAISNVAFAAEGKVYVENVADMNADSISLPGDYSHLDGVENLSKWELPVEGESCVSRILTVENGKLCLRKRGLRVIFR